MQILLIATGVTGHICDINVVVVVHGLLGDIYDLNVVILTNPSVQRIEITFSHSRDDLVFIHSRFGFTSGKAARQVK